MKTSPSLTLLREIIYIAQTASNAILEIYQKNHSHTLKSDGSPITDADICAHRIILEKLSKRTPDMPIVSEESLNLKELNQKLPKQFWLVDPLDGTKEFISRNGEFTVNIALVEEGKPTLGVVTAPALQTVYAGTLQDGAFKLDANGHQTPISVSIPGEEGLTVLGSRSHQSQAEMNAFLQNKKVSQFIPAGSSLKFCKLAEGSAHLYPRFGRTMEWDTAAGHAILLAAGGTVETLDNTPLTYGKQGFENPHFIARACQL